MVATSGTTGGRNCPQDSSSAIGSIPSCSIKKTPHRGVFFYGAGYGNRTRLHGLGSRCITDIRTLRTRCIIPNQNSNFNPFLSTTQNKNPADCRPRQSHTISESQRRRIPRCSTAFPHTEQPRGPVRSCQESGWSHSQLHSLP